MLERMRRGPNPGKCDEGERERGRRESVKEKDEVELTAMIEAQRAQSEGTTALIESNPESALCLSSSFRLEAHQVLLDDLFWRSNNPTRTSTDTFPSSRAVDDGVRPPASAYNDTLATSSAHAALRGPYTDE